MGDSLGERETRTLADGTGTTRLAVERRGGEGAQFGNGSDWKRLHRAHKAGDKPLGDVSIDVTFPNKSPTGDKVCNALGYRSTKNALAGWSLWERHAIPTQDGRPKFDTCSVLPREFALSDKVAVRFDRTYAAAVDGGGTIEFRHFLLVPAVSMTKAELQTLGDEIGAKMQPCVLEAAGESQLKGKHNGDGNATPTLTLELGNVAMAVCDIGGMQRALLCCAADAEAAPCRRSDAAILAAWLGGQVEHDEDFILEELPAKAPWACAFALDCLDIYRDACPSGCEEHWAVAYETLKRLASACPASSAGAATARQR